MVAEWLRMCAIEHSCERAAICGRNVPGINTVCMVKIKTAIDMGESIISGFESGFLNVFLVMDLLV